MEWKEIKCNYLGINDALEYQSALPRRSVLLAADVKVNEEVTVDVDKVFVS